MQAMPSETGQIQSGTLIANCPQPKPTRNTAKVKKTIGLSTHCTGENVNHGELQRDAVVQRCSKGFIAGFRAVGGNSGNGLGKEAPALDWCL